MMGNDKYESNIPISTGSDHTLERECSVKPSNELNYIDGRDLVAPKSSPIGNVSAEKGNLAFMQSLWEKIKRMYSLNDEKEAEVEMKDLNSPDHQATDESPISHSFYDRALIYLKKLFGFA